MGASYKKLIQSYLAFKKQQAVGTNAAMQKLASEGQHPEVMVLSCCDSRVDPALLFQCNPGDLFTVRNVANIVPPYEMDAGHHGTSAALEYGICHLNVKHLIVLGHSQCGGIDAMLKMDDLTKNDFISRWVSLVDLNEGISDAEQAAKQALLQSYQQALTYPWIKERLDSQTLDIHLWYFDIKSCDLYAYSFARQVYEVIV
ncbi:MAG: carbonate dehydratase [Coxiella sp. (in: Bacteria)]|nr:MAG: carbonate dehydratase [Coxiella sp. (in: g-proteobacteria)]